MTNEPTEPDLGDEAVGDEAPVEPEVRNEIPERLDLPLEVPEADALEQELEVPIEDDDH